MTLIIAHLSDLHFSCPSYHPEQFFSKRWLGNFNLLLFRRRLFQTAYLQTLPTLLTSLNVEATFITGDFTTTSRKVEFKKARAFVDLLAEPTYSLPGNHDVYTRKADQEKLFYTYFPDEELRKERITVKPLKKGWWAVSLDCAVATPLFRSYGVFFPPMREKLQEALEKIPQSDSVIVANHFPLFSSGHPSHDLHHAEELRAILMQSPQVKVYLHGHEHKPYILDKKAENLPLVVNAGSSTYHPEGIFYVLKLEQKECEISTFHLTAQENETSLGWSFKEKGSYLFR